MRKLSFFSCLLFFVFTDVWSQNLTWAKQIGGASLDYAYAMAVDKQGYTYVTGFFQGTSDFDPGPLTLNYSSAGIEDVFVEKLSPAGNLVWAKRFGSTSSDYGFGIAVDDTGNVLVAGYFQAKCDFDPGADTFYLNTAGNRDVFVSKLDSSGNFKWAKRFGSTLYEEAYGIGLDKWGNIYTTGYFMGKVDFNPGLDTFFLSSAGSFDVFVSKLGPSGNFKWAKNIGGIKGDFGRSVALDTLGNSYVTGVFQGTADFDPGITTYIVTSNGGDDVFVMKLDSAGNFSWAKSFGSITKDYVYSIALDKKRNVYTTGNFQLVADFDPGAGTDSVYSKGSLDAFVHSMDASGNYRWAKNLGGIDYDEGKAISVDKLGNVYTSGAFLDTVDFDPGPGVFKLATNGDWDIFVHKMDSSGNFNWAVSMGGWDIDYAFAISVDASESVYTTGFFYDTVDFDPGPGVFEFGTKGQSDIYVHKINQLPMSVKQMPYEKDLFSVYPNPAKDMIMVDLGVRYDEAEITIFDLTGKEVQSAFFKNTTRVQVSTANLGNGMYVLTVRMEDKMECRKIVVGR